MGLTDMYRGFRPATTQYTFFSAAHGTFSKIDQTLGHKASIYKYMKIKITSCTLSDYKEIQLELNNKRNYRKYANTWRLDDILLIKIMGEIVEEIMGETK
jgi:hypothetical protein